MGSLKMSDPQWIGCVVRRPVLCKSHAVLCCCGLVKRTYQHRRGAFLISLKTGNKISEFQFLVTLGMLKSFDLVASRSTSGVRSVKLFSFCQFLSG